MLATDDKSSLKGAWSGHVDYLNYGGINRISGTAKAIVVKCCVHVHCVKSQFTDDNWQMTIKGAWFESLDSLYILAPQRYLWNGLS